MGWGNPDFLIPYWEARFPEWHLDLSENLAYQFTGIPQLKENVIKLHNKVGNASTEGKTVVIGNGATHILNGLIQIHSSPLVYAKPPNYHKFYDYIKVANKTWSCHKNALEIVTIPNNPDGETHKGYSDFQVHDLSYNWPTYVDHKKLNHDVMIFGLSKATGHASARVGWALLEDEKLAEEFDHWVHLTSCGISYYAQAAANRVIKNQLYTEDTVFKYGRKILINRWKKVYYGLDLPFTRLNGTGMFMWCKGECPKDINSIPGELFGGGEDYFRLSMGVSEDTWQEFVRRYGK